MSTPPQELRAELALLQRERDYYKRHADELAGEAVKRDYTISTLRHALKQKTQGFALLAELQRYIGQGQHLQEIFEYTNARINALLGMDRSVALVLDAPPDQYRPDSWSGFEADFAAALPELRVDVPHSWVRRGEAILANSAAPMTPLIRRLQEAFALPHFILLPVLVSGEPIGLLLTGRQREQKPFAPPLDEGDVDTLQAIATLIASFVHARDTARQLDFAVSAGRGSLQKVQRHLRPRCRRRDSEAGRAAHHAGTSARRHGRALRRRGVRGDSARHQQHRRGGGGRARARTHRRRADAARHHRRIERHHSEHRCGDDAAPEWCETGRAFIPGG
jgi:hypothetical protein